MPDDLAEPIIADSPAKKYNPSPDLDRPLGPTGHPQRAKSSEGATIGFVAGMGAAVSYTAANICLRSVVHCDPFWVAGVKALPTVVFAAPWLLALMIKGRPLYHSTGLIARLLIVSVAAQVLGNGLFQWALGQLGLALAIPLTLGGVLIGSAIVGKLFLQESVTRTSLISIGVLVASICVLSTGASEASSVLNGQLARPDNTSLQSTVLAIVAFCVAGFVFSTLGAVVRSVGKSGMPLSTILFASSMVGVVLLCGVALVRDPTLLSQTDIGDWKSMLLAGTFNALAFLALTIALKRIRLLYVNALNVTQTAMAGLAGVVLFSEPISAQLVIGIVLTMAGVFLMDRH